MSSVKEIQTLLGDMEQAYTDLKKVPGEDTEQNRQVIGEFSLLNAVALAQTDRVVQKEEENAINGFITKHPELKDSFYGQFKNSSFSDQLRARFLAHVIANRPAPLAPDAKTTYTNMKGESYQDPYRSMESFSSTDGKIDPRAQAYIDNLSRYSTMLLRSNPEVSRLETELKALNQAGVNQSVHASRHPDGSYIYTALKPGETGLPKLYKKTADGTETVLVDPNKLTKPKEKWSLSGFSVSPSGRYVIYDLKKNGDKQTRTFGLYDIAKKREISLTPPAVRAYASSVAWTKDETGFFYSPSHEIKPGMPKEDLFINESVMFHSLTQNSVSSIVDRSFNSGVALTPITHPEVHIHPGSDFAILETWEGVEKERTIYVKRLGDIQNKNIPWRKVADSKQNKVHEMVVHKNTIYVISRENASAGKILAIDLDKPRNTIANARTVVAHNPKIVIKNIEVRADGLYIHKEDRGYSQLFIMPYNKPGKLEAIALPFIGSLRFTPSSPLSTGVIFTESSWIHPSVSLTYDPKKKKVESTGLDTPSTFRSEDYAIEIIDYPGLDGVKIPLTFYYNKKLYPNGLPKDKQAIPYALKGYGSYGANYQWFDPAEMLFLNRKGVIAYPSLRGGGEYGDDWWNAGKIETKHTTWEDEGMAAKFLIEQGYTTKGMIVADNFSAGGLAGARAAVDPRFKEYLAAVYNDGCVLDQVRTEYEPLGKQNIPEFGSSETQLNIQIQMSPAHQVRQGQIYPRFFINVDMADVNVLAQEGFKMAAALAYAHPDNQPILKVGSYGHMGSGGDVDDSIRAGAEKVAWMLWVTGKSPRMNALYQQAETEAAKLKAGSSQKVETSATGTTNTSSKQGKWYKPWTWSPSTWLK